MKVAVVFWSGTGNTEAMARAVAEGVQKAGAEAALLTSDEFGVEQVAAFDNLRLWLPGDGRGGAGGGFL